LKREGERSLVAREAARLIYYCLADEYKQAKEKATDILGVKSLPSNFEVAVELDRIADEVEGASRRDLILRLRREALGLMIDLKEFSPKLVGSVWRGTAKKGSDIDITVYCQDPDAVLDSIKKKHSVRRVEETSKTDKGITERFIHIYVTLNPEDEAEIVLRNIEYINETYRCDKYGDTVTGLTIHQLEKVLRTDSLQKFVPKQR
jgi:predicted nucleotidyltransferase